jgi:hypothetical protein
MFKHKLKELKTFLKNHPRTSWLIGGMAATLILTGGLILALRNDVSVERTQNQVSTAETQPELVPSPTTGLDVSPSVAERPVMSVIVSNSVGARPQAGLSSADVVFETIAEGGITRYLALFHDKTPENIGPVRSLRPYFIDWAIPFDAAVAHVGGSPKALDQAKTRLKGRDLDEFRFGRQTYTRVGSRLPPHNTYTSFDRLRDAAKSIGMTTSDVSSIERATADAVKTQMTDTQNATSLSIPFSSDSYNTTWTYSSGPKTYKRSLAGEAHKDADNNQQIAVDTVVVIRTSFGTDTYGGTTYADPDSVGNGDAVIFQNGKALEVSWSREKDGQYTFKKGGEEVAIKKGSMWIAVQPTNQPLNYD